VCDVGRGAVTDCFKMEVFLHLYLLFYYIYFTIIFENRRTPVDSCLGKSFGDLGAICVARKINLINDVSTSLLKLIFIARAQKPLLTSFRSKI